VWHRAVELVGTVAVTDEWFIALVIYRSRTVAACLHVLQALTALPTRTSCRSCQAHWKLASVRWEHVCLAAQAGLIYFSLCLRPVPHKELWDTWLRRSPHQPGGEVRSHMTRDNVRAHLSREVRSGAIGHVTATEPTSTGRRGLEP
jgi:hypothetical protein